MNDLDRIKYLTDYLNEMTVKYDAGQPVISDKEWDNLYFELKALEDKTGIVMVDSPTQTIHYEVVSSLEKRTHNHHMLSLAKTKDWDEFIHYFNNKDVVGMIKLDGLTCSLEYVDGVLTRAETRGNGLVGEDILHNARVISSIPKRIPYQEDLIIDGEVICTNDDFITFADEYANSRNFASGSIRLLDSQECAKRKLTFVAWNVVSGINENSFIKRLNKLEELGFLVVPWTSSLDLDAKEFLINEAKKYGYPMDGLVGRFDDVSYGRSLGETDHHSKAAFAFKFYDETYHTTLKNIEWTMGRTGILTPVAVFEPLDIEGSIVERASLHNYSIMSHLLWKPYVGQSLEIFKANMIIPQVAEAELPDLSAQHEWIIPPVRCPYCDKMTVSVEISDTGIENLVCKNPNCEGKLINRLDHFCGKKGLDIKGLSKATIGKLIDWGWINSAKDFYSLTEHRDEWIKKPGFGIASVDKLLAAIQESRNFDLQKFIVAIGIPEIGANAAKELIKHYSTWDDFRQATYNDLINISGFGNIMVDYILNYNYFEADSIVKDCMIITYESNDITVESNTSLLDKTFVITGKLSKKRDDIISDIESYGGKVTGSVSSKTNYLVNNDSASTSSKNIKAQQLGIPIITEEELYQMM